LGFTLSEVYACEPDEEVLRLIQEFALMVKWWAEKGEGFEGGPYEEFRKRHYNEWVERWPEWNRQLIHTSVHVAYDRLNLSAKPEDRPKTVNLDVNFAVLHPKMLKLEGERLRISVSSGRGGYAYARLIPKGFHQKKLLEQAQSGLWVLGQAIITKNWIMLPFTAVRLDDETLEAVSTLLER